MSFRQPIKLIFYPLFLCPAIALLLTVSSCSHTPSIRPAVTKATADALNLLINKEYTVNRDGSYDLHLQLKRKILTYKGKKDFADFKFTYNNRYQSLKINKAQTTIPDGSVITADEKEYHDIQSPWTAGASIYSHSRQEVINLPAVRVGATIEIDITLHSQLGFWTSEIFRLTNPIRQKNVSIAIPRGMKLMVLRPSWMAAATVKNDQDHDVYHWHVSNVPAQVPEQLMPADENGGNCLLVSTFTDWQQVASWYRDRLFRAGNNQKPLSSTVIKQAGLDISSVSKLYASLMRRITPHPIDFLSTSLEPQKPKTTILKGHGTPTDLALAFYQILKQQQIPARLLLINTHGVLLREFSRHPSPGLLTNPLVRCGNRDYSFQQQELPPGFTGYEGHHALDLEDGRLKPIITSFANRRSSTVSLQPTGRGFIDGSLHTVLTGQPAIAIRSQLRYLTPAELRVATSQLLHGIDPLAGRSSPVKTTGIDNPGQPVTIDVHFTIPRGLPFAGGYAFINLPRPAFPDDYTTCRQSRRNPLLIDNDFIDNVEIRLLLPHASNFKALPATGSGQLTHLCWESAGRVDNETTLVWTRKLSLKQGIIPANEAYQQFRQAIITLYEPQSRMVIIKPAP